MVTSSAKIVGGTRWGGARHRPNIHVAYDTPVFSFHTKLADLATRYTGEQGRLLDVGCGSGVMLRCIHDRNPALSLLAADLDPMCLTVTAEKTPLVASAIMPDGDTDPLKQLGPVDTVVCSHVLEHTHAPILFIRALLDVIAPGGHLILAVPNPVRPTVFVNNLIRKHYVNRGHVFAWDRSHWMNFLENICDLDVVEYATDQVDLPIIQRLPGATAVGRALAQVVPWWGFSNIAVIRK